MKLVQPTLQGLYLSDNYPIKAGLQVRETDISRCQPAVIRCKPVKIGDKPGADEKGSVVKMSRATVAILFTQTNMLIALPQTVTFGFDRDDRFRGSLSAAPYGAGKSSAGKRSRQL